MSDHGSGPRALTDPAADLTDVFAFPAPGNPQHLVVVMDVFSRAGPSAVFSDAVIYRFRFRRVRVAATGPGAAFAVDDDEATFDFTFDVPEGTDTTRPLQRGRCRTPNGETVSFHVNDEKGASGPGVQVFAGRRSDPFFLNLRGIEKTIATGRIAFEKVGSDTLYGTNVLSIVLELEWAKLLDGGPMFAVVCETLRAGPRPVRFERLGRPEIKNVSLSLKMLDPVNRDLEIRDLYNSEDAFALTPDYVGAYRARFNANLPFYDRLDGKIDWPPGQRRQPSIDQPVARRLPRHRCLQALSRAELLRNRARDARRSAACHGRWTLAQRRHHGLHLHALYQRW